jgi:tetratricopeptide (TPR) repeat protein
MIVRDSAATLGACLGSIRPWVDEMIVVDTGSKDETIGIAKSFGAKVYEFAWPDSFAEARNQSLAHATGEWLFWMDSDDTISPENGQKLRDLSRKKTGAMAYIMQVVCPNTSLPAEERRHALTVVDHVKMFRNSPQIRFSGRIHEQILPSIRRLAGEVEWTDIQIVHSGSDQSAAGRARKQARDLRLIEMELGDDPDNSFALFNYGMTLLDAARPADALNALARSLQLATPGESHCRKIYALLAQAYCDLRRPATALKTCLAGLAQFPGDTELVYRKGDLNLLMNNGSEAEAAFRELTAPPSQRYFSSFDRTMTGVKAWQGLAASLEKQNRPAEAEAAWLKAMEFDGDNRRTQLGLIDAYTRLKNADRLEEIAGRGAGYIAVIARSRGFLVRGDPAGAMNVLRGGVEWDEVLDELCRQLFTSSDLGEAERWLEELVKRRPGDASAHLNLAVIYMRQGDRARAAEHARISLDLRPNYPPAVELLRSATVTS